MVHYKQIDYMCLHVLQSSRICADLLPSLRNWKLVPQRGKSGVGNVNIDSKCNEWLLGNV